MMFYFQNIFTGALVFSLIINFYDDSKLLSQIFYGISQIQ